MGIHDHGGRAVGKRRAGELVDHELGRLDVHVAVDEPRQQDQARGVERGPSTVRTMREQPGDVLAGDGDVDLQQLAGEHRHDPASRTGPDRRARRPEPPPAGGRGPWRRRTRSWPDILPWARPWWNCGEAVPAPWRPGPSPPATDRSGLRSGSGRGIGGRRGPVGNPSVLVARRPPTSRAIGAQASAGEIAPGRGPGGGVRPPRVGGSAGRGQSRLDARAVDGGGGIYGICNGGQCLHEYLYSR